MNAEPIPGVFGFESFMERTLEYMPLSVRMNLDLCGVKLSLAQWCGLPLAVRQIVLEMRCDTAAEIHRVRSYLEFIVEAFRLGPLLPILCDAQSWGPQSRVPATLAAALHSLRLPRLSKTAWTGLSNLQRFALIRLTGEGNLPSEGSSRNLQAALQEFGLGEPRPPAPETPEAADRSGQPTADAGNAADPLAAAGMGDGDHDALVFAFLAKALRERKHRRFEREADGTNSDLDPSHRSKGPGPLSSSRRER
jgi:hypothetical protein